MLAIYLDNLLWTCNCKMHILNCGWARWRSKTCIIRTGHWFNLIYVASVRCLVRLSVTCNLLIPFLQQLQRLLCATYMLLIEEHLGYSETIGQGEHISPLLGVVADVYVGVGDGAGCEGGFETAAEGAFFYGEDGYTAHGWQAFCLRLVGGSFLCSYEDSKQQEQQRIVLWKTKGSPLRLAPSSGGRGR